MTDTSIFVYAVFGGIITELFKWYKLRESPNIPEYARNRIYWLITLGMVAAGGILALAYGPQVVTTRILALNIGVSAPLIIQTLASAMPRNLQHGFAADAPEPSILNFLAGR